MAVQLRRTPGHLDRSRQVAPQIFETLRVRILSLELKPNTLLSRAALQAEFGVSQTPVRDALMRLEQEGLVEIYPQHATLVARIDLRAARQAHFLRLAIELEAVRRVAAEHDSAFVPTLRQAVDALRSSADDYEAFAGADRAFHQLFYEAAGVPDLFHLVGRHSGHIDRLRRLNLPLPGKMEAVIRDHEALVAAVARGDAEGAAAILRRHLSGTLSIVDQIRERHPDYFLPD
ncbi:MAG TPA: GntR family transcriptional regulator [Alphaproteobacteria bacterium]|nr:GntR family transcriptional regulator [Alphaproteobacteria bacterium]